MSSELAGDGETEAGGEQEDTHGELENHVADIGSGGEDNEDTTHDDKAYKEEDHPGVDVEQPPEPTLASTQITHAHNTLALYHST
jgi:hypothetical protein